MPSMKRFLRNSGHALAIFLCSLAASAVPTAVHAGGVVGPPANPDIVVVIERPTGDVAGTAAIQGFAFASAGIDRLDWVLDGQPMGNLPHGGERGDVPPAYPGYPIAETKNSGFSATWLMALLLPGQHEIIVNAYDNDGGVNSDSVTFTSHRFGDGRDRFIAQSEVEMQTFVLQDVKLYPGESAHKLFDVEFSWSQGAQSWVVTGIEVSCDTAQAFACPYAFVDQVAGVALQERTFPFFVEVSWTASNSPLVGYEIQRRQVFGQIVGQWGTVGYVPGFATFFNDYGVGILGNDVYEYRVRGFHAAGSGDWSAPVQIPAGNGPIVPLP